MTSLSGNPGKRGTTGTVTGSVVPEFSQADPVYPGRRSSTEISLRSRVSDWVVLRPGRIILKFFLPEHDPVEKIRHDRS